MLYVRCTLRRRNRHPNSLQTSTILVLFVSQCCFTQGVHPPRRQEGTFSQAAPTPPPFPSLHLNFLPFLPRLPYLTPLPPPKKKIELGLKNVVSFPSRVRDGAPAATAFFYTFWAFKTHLVAKFLVFYVQC